MSEAELAEAISARAGARVLGGALRARLAGALFALAWLRRAKPVRVLVLSVSALAAGALGQMTAYAISPDLGSAARVLVTGRPTGSRR